MTGFTTNYNKTIPNTLENDLYLDPTTGYLAIVTSPIKEIEENCIHELQLIKGEYNFDISKGIAWNYYLTQEVISQSSLAFDIKNTLLQVNGVLDVSSVSLQVVNNSLQINAEIQLEKTSLRISL